MTRKHFQMAADDLRLSDLTDKERKASAEILASIFKQINPAFDKGRFFTAAGI